MHKGNKRVLNWDFLSTAGFRASCFYKMLLFPHLKIFIDNMLQYFEHITHPIPYYPLLFHLSHFC